MKRLQPKIVRQSGAGPKYSQRNGQNNSHIQYNLPKIEAEYQRFHDVDHAGKPPSPTTENFWFSFFTSFIFSPPSLRISPLGLSGRSLPFAATLATILTLAATPADAHMGTGLPGGFASGFLHPLTGFDHLLAMVSVGLWGAFLGRPLIVALPVIFPTVMAFGAFLGMANVPFPPVEIGIGLSVLLLGGVIAAAWRAPIWAACTIVAVFALFHGYAHGKELPSAADPIGYSVGFVLSTGLLHIAGVGIGLLNDRPGGILVTRILGGGVALAGLYFFATAIFK